MEPNIDAIFYKSILRIDLEKVCKKCNKYRINYKAGDMKAGVKYYSECFKNDSIIYNDISNSDIIYYCSLYIPLCSGKESVTFNFSKKRIKDETISTFVIESDSTLSKNTNPISNYPDLKNISSGQIYYIQTPNMAIFPGGEDARIRYLQENIRYPHDARDNGICGIVRVSFIIDEKGMVTNPKIIKGISKSCDEECLRLIESMPRWNPGKEDGKAVKFRFVHPIKFTLVNY
jgi:TonB family protein